MFYTELPRYLKLLMASVSHHMDEQTERYHQLSFQTTGPWLNRLIKRYHQLKLPNDWTFVLVQETFSPRDLASPCSTSRAIASTFSNSVRSTASAPKTRSVTLMLDAPLPHFRINREVENDSPSQHSQSQSLASHRVSNRCRNPTDPQNVTKCFIMH